MKYYCGTDIIEVDRVKSAILSTPNFKEKVFTTAEINIGDSKSEIARYQYYAGRFAAKEAIYKSLSNINNMLTINQIEIINDITNKNRPVVRLLDTNLSKLQQTGMLTIDVSISHIKDFATANAITHLK